MNEGIRDCLLAETRKVKEKRFSESKAYEESTSLYFQV